MSLNSSSTIADAEAAYKDNLSYSTDGSVAKARLFIEACRFLLAFMPRAIGGAGDSMTLSPDLIQQEMHRAEKWAVNHSDSSVEIGPRVTRSSFKSFR